MTEIVRGKAVPAPQLAAARALRSRRTPAEAYLWQHLRVGQLGGHRFRRQQPIGPSIADFYCASARLVIELDGPIHEHQRDYDRERDAYLAAHDFTVLHDLNALLRAIRDAIATPNPLLAGEGRRPQSAG